MGIGFMHIQDRKLDQTNSAVLRRFGLSPSFLPAGFCNNGVIAVLFFSHARKALALTSICMQVSVLFFGLFWLFS